LDGAVKKPHPIRRLLIANRGEIAVRIARAAREAGIVPLGVYSDADAHAYHLEFMDESARLGPAPATESYLNAERLIEAARALGADALHPGYGFLSERAPFARAVAAAGITFVGPPADAIAAMGDKTEAKRRAREHDVPVVPGYDGDEQSPEVLEREARAIGTPLLIKASAGGGGRGMRVVNDLGEFDESLDAAKREALAAFGDAKVLLEQYLVRPHHIEFQILADAEGATIFLGERECSIQRRHQKIVEEAPSVALTAELRTRMGYAAVRAARSVGYVNAGTVEFLLDEDGAFYFLEMNARLQVEHPVTELVHGVDLVRLQLDIAGGERLRLKQSEIATRGWAIEMRINAEDPANAYLPATGTIVRWDAPSGPGLRIDSGVRAGSEVSIYYDSMLAKLIAHAPDRAAAIERLAAGLEAFRIEGVPTNIPLLLKIARDPAFREGRTTTAFLTERAALLQSDPAGESDEAFLAAIGAALGAPGAWRIGGVGIPLALRGTHRSVSVVASRTGDAWRLAGDIAGEFHFGENGRASVDSAGVSLVHDGTPLRFEFAHPPSLAESGAGRGAGHGGAITSPMPGKIIKVAVKAGDSVAERDLLIVLEAMKMEHRIEAPRSGKVKSVAVTQGTLVKSGATLVEIE
jgi:3-methylcrotonyl-CoA carboxylase alpha subunit